MGNTKVFGIGFHKTGTTSLAKALEVLGYRVTGPNGVSDPDISVTVRPMAWKIVEEYDAFQDNPWPVLFREIDERYPGSKFILSSRPSDEWIRSVVRHFGGGSTPMREWIYGVGDPLGQESTYVARYEEHNSAVLAHFRSRPEDLLVLPITEGAGWSELCRFLGHPVPSAAFPTSNRALERRFPAFRTLRRARDQVVSGIRGM